MHHLDFYKERYPELVELITNSLYVDDLLAGASDVQEGFEVYQQSKELMVRGGVHLYKWNSNLPGLLQLINNKGGAVVQLKTEEATHQMKRKRNPLPSLLLVQIKCPIN